MGACSKAGDAVSKTAWVGSIPAAYAKYAHDVKDKWRRVVYE
jgi:hypothetical protein